MMFRRLDHVAVEVDDLDAFIDTLEACSMRLIRRGTRFKTGQAIVMVGDGTGTKLELIESAGSDAVVAHVAFDVDDLDAAVKHLAALGWTCLRPAHDLGAARARTALMSNQGINVQLITYEPDSPDIAVWDRSPEPVSAQAPSRGE